MWQKLKNQYHLVKAVIANVIYWFPANDMVVIGVTGTDGKTTVSSLIYHILHQTGEKTALISTVSAIIDGKNYDTGFHVSTPDAFALQAYLKKAKDAGTKYLVLEVTSHGLDQNRAYGVPFTVGVLTNITHEHLDYHGTYENYVRAKFKLLRNARIAIVNKDDKSFDLVTRLKKKLKTRDKKWVTYGLGNNADISPNTFHFKSTLKGEYNRYNCLAAIAVCRHISIPDDTIRTAIANFTPPKGRGEVVYDKEFRVIIDFAHTPNGLTQILKTLSDTKNTGAKIIHVLGAAGERDRGKRPLMGSISAEYADVTILTSEDPRSESVDTINNMLEEGYRNSGKGKGLLRINDRQEAITHAIKMAEKGDVVILTGKGHEKSMNLGKGEVHWSDHEAVEQALHAVNNT